MNKIIRLALSGIVSVFGLWISTQWFARSMAFSSDLGEVLSTVFGMKLYAPTHFLGWIPQFYSTERAQLTMDALPFMAALCFSVIILKPLITKAPSARPFVPDPKSSRKSVQVDSQYVEEMVGAETRRIDSRGGRLCSC